MDGVSLRRRACVVCGEPFQERGRMDRMYCLEGGCRTLAWKERKRRKTEAVEPRTPGAEGAPAASYADYAPRGTLVQLAQRQEADLMSTQRALTAAQQRIAELQKNLGAAEDAQPHQPVEVQSLVPVQDQTAQAARNRLVELEQVLRDIQQENAELKKQLQAAQAHRGELQTQLSADQPAKTAAEESEPKAQAPLLNQGRTRESEGQQHAHLQSQLATADEGATKAVQRADATQQQAQAAAESLARTHAQYAQEAVAALAAALRVRGTEDEGTMLAWLDARRQLLHRVAVNVARDAQRAVAEGETDRKAIATRALDWTRGRVLSELAEPHVEETRALFHEHRPLFCQLAELVTASVSAGVSVPSGVPAARMACAQVAHEVLDQLSTLVGQPSGELSDTSAWVAGQRPLLVDFCQAVVARARFAASTKRATTAIELTHGSVADIGWRHFSERAAANRWAAANRATLERLATALLAAS